MIDSHEKALEEGTKTEEEKNMVTDVQAAADTAAAGEGNAEGAAPADSTEAMDSTKQKTYTSKKEVLDRVKELAHGDEVPAKDEVDYLKTVFYKLHIAERDALYKAFLEGGGEPESYHITPDEHEEAFKAEMGIIKERRSRMIREQEAEREENYNKKLAIIEKIKNMVTSPEEANQSYQEFKTLQQEWKEIKNIPPSKANDLWRSYQLYVEQFYDLLKLNSEAREYDLKKNLETKTRLCEAAESLANEEDVISAFHQLQKLHQEYRETGPVAKELREEIWVRFKAASTVVNKNHQQHFDNIRAKEEENLRRKTELCEKVEAITAEENKGTNDWEKHTKQIIEVQNEWKTIGFAPQKMNVKIFERFRAACDDFFTRKAEHYKALKETFKSNAEKKRALIEKAKAMMDSTDWKATSDKFIALQNEWKTIGTVPKRLSDQLWEEFIGACNHFFEARNKANAGQRSEEHSNLDKKKGVIEKLKQLLENPVENLQETLQQLTEEYNSIGHVPFKEKDKIYNEYHELTDKIYKELHVSVTKRRLSNFKTKLKAVAEQGESAIDNERAKLMRQFEAIKNEVQTYENNLGFLNASSKKGNSLIEEMNRKMEKLKDDLKLVKEKIKAIDNRNKEQ